jgi:hypothetical protein
MAVVTIKSGPITNRDASPRVLNNQGLNGGLDKTARGTIETNGTDSIGSTYIFCSIPSNAFIKDILLSCDGNNTTGAADIGIYRSTEDGGAVVDADLFASAQSIATALTRSSIVHESGVFGIEDVETPLWSLAGESSDPNVMYDIVLTLTAADDAADTVSLEVTYN